LSEFVRDGQALKPASLEMSTGKAEVLFTDGFLASVYRRAYALVGHREDAEDVAQEACLQLWKESRLGRHFEFLAAWMNTVMRNALFAQFRKTRPDRQLSFAAHGDPFHEEAEGGLRDLPDPAPSALDAILAEEKRERDARLVDRVVRALAELPEGERNCVMMCARGYTFVQIAKALDLDYRTTIRMTRTVIAKIRAGIEA
jgi:RNA polymerase sigma factor (sigma-70 family)